MNAQNYYAIPWLLTYYVINGEVVGVMFITQNYSCILST